MDNNILVIGIAGGSASGKTTLIKLANGLLVPTMGQIWINGTTTISATTS